MNILNAQIFGLNILKSAVIIIFMLLYLKFVYYPYHKKAPLSFFTIGAALIFIGIWVFFFEKSVIFNEVKSIYFLMILFLIVSFSLLILAIKKHGLKTDIDITLTWCKKIFPFIPYWFWMTISPILFFAIVGTYRVIGKEHLFFWGIIFLAWIASNIRLYKKWIVK